jgi:Zn-dependent protease with chaperone function
MSNIAGNFRTDEEKVYGVVMLVLGALLWVLIAWGIWGGLHSANPTTAGLTRLYLGYGVAIALFYVISSALYRATAFGNMILLGPKQFPELHAMVVAGAEQLGMGEPPRTFLYNSNGLFNAFARRLLGGRYVFLTSALVEANDDEKVRFVIGHELGHHAAGHLNPWKNFIRLPAYLIPFLQPAYSRAREYTCDKIGANLSKDIAISRSSLQMLGCGCRRMNHAMNCEAFMAQEEMVPPIFGFLSEIIRSHPRLTRRISAIKD